MSLRRNRKAASPSDTRESVINAAATSYDWAAPKVEAARGWATPKVEAARDWAGPRVEPAIERVKGDVVPKVTGAMAGAVAASDLKRSEAKSRGKAAIAALKGEVRAPKPRKRRFGGFLVLTAIAGAAVAGWKALTGSKDDYDAGAWSSPTGESEPWAAAPTSTGFGAAETTPVGPVPLADDIAGASPDEALADVADESETIDIAAVTTEPVTADQAAAVEDASKDDYSR